ncbi:MAG: helix-turn-helix domain-containing protein [Rhodobacter sp.]|nr:helix-turn-helix domain-containing protein [Rhodobacter sp.]
MPGHRSYALLCPIARALDHVGDRWSLLILRDLHAGPARYSDLMAGLPGIAANLLSARLVDLTASGMVEKDGAGRGARYRLTDLGRATRPILFELSRFGARLPAPAEPVEPGNRRHVAVTLAAAAERVAPADLSVRAEIVLDGQPFSFVASRGRVSMEEGAMLAPPLRYTGRYDLLGPVVAGTVSFADHLDRDATLESLDGTDAAPFAALLAEALDVIGGRR